jgi:hypothetical protein
MIDKLRKDTKQADLNKSLSPNIITLSSEPTRHNMDQYY